MVAAPFLQFCFQMFTNQVHPPNLYAYAFLYEQLVPEIVYGKILGNANHVYATHWSRVCKMHNMLYVMSVSVCAHVSPNMICKVCGDVSGDSWMYPYQRTPMENPSI